MGTVRNDVLAAIAAGYETNIEIAAFTGHALATVASCTRRLHMDEVVLSETMFKAGPGSMRHYRINPHYQGGGLDRQASREFPIPEPDPLLVALFGRAKTS